MKVIITFTFCCDNLWKSKFLVLEKPGKLGIFFSYFEATLSDIDLWGIVLCVQEDMREVNISHCLYLWGLITKKS